jgi:hypothetical protein
MVTLFLNRVYLYFIFHHLVGDAVYVLALIFIHAKDLEGEKPPLVLSLNNYI